MLDFRLVRQLQHSEREHVVGVLPSFQRVVISFQFVQFAEVLLDVEQFPDQRTFVFAIGEINGWADLANRAEHFHDENAVVRDDGTSALTDDVRVVDLLRVADVTDVINDIVRVFLQGVIGRAVERRPAAVIIDTQAAANINVFDGKAHLVKFGVETRRLLDRFFDSEDVRHLRADVKMNQLETVCEVLRLEQGRGGKQFNGAQTELCIFSRAFRPFAGTFAEQAGTDANEGFDAKLARDADDLLKLLQLFHDHDHLLAQFDPHQRHADEVRVLVAVADDQAVRIGLEGESGKQLRLAANFQSKIVGLAGVEDFLHHLAKLIDFDWEDAAVASLIVEFGDGVAKGLVDGLDAMPENVLEADEQRQFEPACPGLFDDIVQIHRGAGFLLGRGNDVPGFVDVEIFRAPAVDVVKTARRLDVPGARAVR